MSAISLNTRQENHKWNKQKKEISVILENKVDCTVSYIEQNALMCSKQLRT
jgi:hypothetical protein